MFKGLIWWVLCLSAVVMWTVLPISLQMTDNDRTRELSALILSVVGGSSILFSVSLLDIHAAQSDR